MEQAHELLVQCCHAGGHQWVEEELLAEPGENAVCVVEA